MPQERFYIPKNTPFSFHSQNKEEEVFALGLMLYIKNTFKYLYFENNLDKVSFSATIKSDKSLLSDNKLFHNVIISLLKNYNEEWDSDLMNFDNDTIKNIVLNNINKTFIVNGYTFSIMTNYQEHNNSLLETITILR